MRPLPPASFAERYSKPRLVRLPRKNCGNTRKVVGIKRRLLAVGVGKNLPTRGNWSPTKVVVLLQSVTNANVLSRIIQHWASTSAQNSNWNCDGHYSFTILLLWSSSDLNATINDYIVYRFYHPLDHACPNGIICLSTVVRFSSMFLP